VEFLDPKPGVGMIARKALVPVVPAYIHGSDRLSDVFWGREKLRVFFGEPLDKSEITRYDDAKLGYRELTEEIMRRIKALKEEFLLRSGISK
jgi:1-acyl-sn-glycerol-3-phosphate acyltransferase